MIHQIIYSSESATPMQLDDLEDILDRARSSNAARGITGALIYADGIFLQILEGEKGVLQDLMARIRCDLRHEAVTVLREGEIASATFGSWNMAFVSATPEQVAQWTGQSVANASAEESSEGPTENLSQTGQDPHRTAQFARDILSLLADVRA